ncbi:hypothetical protein Bbelb_140310 [Branchiostoma belcheri]|nr:hypothetical protein Bbelb_140310 [Branchiostoma belcheri]
MFYCDTEQPVNNPTLGGGSEATEARYITQGSSWGPTGGATSTVRLRLDAIAWITGQENKKYVTVCLERSIVIPVTVHADLYNTGNVVRCSMVNLFDSERP